MWRPYDPPADRAAAHRILRNVVRHGPAPFTIHPGDWDWWVFHGDPRFTSEFLIDDEAGALAIVAIEGRTVATFGCPVGAAIDLGRHTFGQGQWTVDSISEGDAESSEILRGLGFEKQGTPTPVFMRMTAGAPTPAPLPDGFIIRPVRGEAEHGSRAAAARRAFRSTMAPDAHAARYLRFMRSTAYVGDNDLVAVAPDGRVAAFTIVWPDAELSLALFEPVGTDPDFQRLGLARAVMADGLHRLEASGIEQARVVTNGDNAAAVALYASCGFTLVDRLVAWRGPAQSP